MQGRVLGWVRWRTRVQILSRTTVGSTQGGWASSCVGLSRCVASSFRMSRSSVQNVEDLLAVIRSRDPDQTEFIQASTEVIESIRPLLETDSKYLDVALRMVEPERMIIFRVPWVDDRGNVHVNRGFRVQFNSAIGPYKGGLRFHPSVNLSIIKFLGFEQILKNSLTTLPLGGAKGGSDFDPKGKSDQEVMRFCQSFMNELFRHIGKDTDVPAGDIGVGGREIGFLFGQYKRLKDSFEGVLTGKGLSYGGSLFRPEATGYGVVYFTQEILNDRGEDLVGKRCLLSGSGNVAQFCAEKLLQLGARVLTLSDSQGTLLAEDGLTREQLDHIFELKNVQRARISAFTEKYPDIKYFEGVKPWDLCDADMAIPCATQNEINDVDARNLLSHGVKYVIEAANMPSTSEAIDTFKENGVVFGPAKAANAGGVAVSGLEMSQNSMRLQWTAEEVDDRLKEIMRSIYTECAKAAESITGSRDDLQLGANLAGFKKVADAMIAEGIV